MPWLTLGTIAPTLNWQQFDIPVLQGELFRVRHNWVGDWPGNGHVHLGSIYADGGRYGFSKSYPDREPKMVFLPIPDDLLQAGFLVRYIGCKKAAYGRTFTAANWTVSVDIWTESTDPENNPVQALDGGVY